jgi:hypothetical protein
MSEQKPSLTLKDYSLYTFRAGLKLIPYIGDALEEFIFRPLAELRMRRIEATLAEIGQSLHDSGESPNVATEEFANLLEAIAPHLSRATNEDRRRRFRDLLRNAATLRQGSADWDEATFASGLLKEIEGPGLAILAAIANCETRYDLTLASRPSPQVYEGDFDYENPQGPQHPISYEWVLVEEWARRLEGMRLIGWQTHHGEAGWSGVYLKPLGEFLMRWALTKNE